MPNKPNNLKDKSNNRSIHQEQPNNTKYHNHDLEVQIVSEMISYHPFQVVID